MRVPWAAARGTEGGVTAKAKPRTRKRVRGWLWFYKDKIDDITLDERLMNKWLAYEYADGAVVPCTITYTLPRRKAGKR